MALTDKLSAIANAIRGKTGGTEKLTLEQMATAIAGIQSGGGGAVSGLAYDMGDIVLDADVFQVDNVPHNLGEVPDFVVVWSDGFADRELPTDYSDNVGYIFMRDMTGLPQRMTSANSTPNGITVRISRTKNETANRLTLNAPTSESYTIYDNEITADTISLKNNSVNNRWRTGVTYHYFVSKAWWNLMEVTV